MNDRFKSHRDTGGATAARFECSRRDYFCSVYVNEVRARAYLIWLQTGRSDPLANWLQAEQETLELHCCS